MKFLDNYQEQTYALLRIMTSFLFIWHGTKKYFQYPNAEGLAPSLSPLADLSPLMYAAGGIEIIAGVLVMIGLFTRPAAFISSGMCAVGYWMVHGSKTFFPILNGGELIALMCFAFLFIAAKGTGIWGLGKD